MKINLIQKNNQMKNLTLSQPKLEITTQQSNLMKYIAVAFERTNTEVINIEKMSFDIISEFKNLPDEDFKKAIRNGGLGKYGRTYKLSTQEICIWVREYLKEKSGPHSRRLS